MPSILLIIRGNSGSGKTTIARKVRSIISNELSDSTMLIQQDMVRRDILKERDAPDKRSTIELVELLVDYGRTHHRTIILEGIFSAKKYGEMLRKIARDFDAVHAYYFDLPFEETLVRHATKSDAHEYGEAEMRAWWNEKDYIHLPTETVLDESMGIDDIVSRIIADIKITK